MVLNNIVRSSYTKAATGITAAYLTFQATFGFAQPKTIEEAFSPTTTIGSKLNVVAQAASSPQPKKLKSYAYGFD